MKLRKGKYPNKTDFDPYFGNKPTDSSGLFELPLSDPAESHPVEKIQERELNDADVNRPSAFGENKKNQLNSNGSPV